MPTATGTRSSSKTKSTWTALSDTTALAGPATASGTAEKASHLICSRSMPVAWRNRITSDQHAPPISGKANTRPITPRGSTSEGGKGVNGLFAYAASCRGPGLNAMKAAVVRTVRTAVQPTNCHRAESSRPSGNRSNTSGWMPVMKTTQVHEPSHAPNKPPGRAAARPTIA